MNKLDKFFEKNLNDFQEADDQWNVPNDRVWEEAKVHFPKKKEEKKSFLWMLLGIGLVLISTISYATYDSFDKESPASTFAVEARNTVISSEPKASKLVESKTILPESTELVNTNEFENENTNTSASLGEGSALVANKAIGEERIAATRVGAAVINRSKVENVLPASNLATLPNSTLTSASSSHYNKENVTVNESTANQGISISGGVSDSNWNKQSSTAITNDETNAKSPAEDIQGLVHPKSENSDNVNSDTHASGKEESRDEASANEDIPFLPVFGISPLDISGNNTAIFDDAKVIVMEKRTSKVEVGLSKNFYLLGLLDGVSLSDGPQDEVTFNSKIRNLNINYRQWVAPNWSIQTGAYISSIEATLDFAVYSLATQEDIEELANTEFREVADRGGRTEDPQLLINLTNAPDVKVGDEIFFDGIVNLKLSAIQIPLMLTYHWPKRKFEYLLGGGLTFEYVTAEQSGEDFKLAVNGNPIEGMISQMDINSNYFDASIYLDAGVKYHLSNSVNLGTTLRLCVTEPVFSGIDVGLFYRW